MSNLGKGREEIFRQLISEQVLACLTSCSLLIKSLRAGTGQPRSFWINDWQLQNHS